MRKFTLAVLTVLFSTGLFSQQTITLNKQSYNGEYYYQGEYQLTSYKDDPENGFLPEVGMVTKFVYSNFSSSVSLEEFVINIVDRSDVANHWTELSNEYALFAENVVANEVAEKGTVRIPVEKTAANPEYGDYTLVIQGRISIDNIESVVLSFSDFAVVKDEEPAIYFVECPAMMKTIQAGSTMNLAPRLKRSNVDFDGTQQWSSSDESVATVDENGVVTAVSEGTVTITVQETDVLKVIYTTEENGESVTYEIGSKHDFKTSFVMYVTPAPIVPDLVIPWNQYGEDVQGIGVDGMSDYWQEGDSKIITDALEAYQEGLSTTYSPTLKDIFMLHIAGTVSCSGQFDFGLADEREQVSYWEDMSVFQKGYKVVADESFDFTIALQISAVVQHTESGDVPLAEPHLMFAFMPEAGSLLGIEKNIECYFDKYTMEFIPAGTVDVSLSQKEYSLDVAGESSVTLSLNLKTLSGNGEWKSLNEDVATVANGVVTGVAQGVAEIVYVEKYYGAEFSDTCKITVLNSTRSPLPETETNISYCMGDKTVPLTAKTVDGGTLTWYDATLAVLESAPTPSADDAGELVYYVSQTIGDKEESEKTLVTVKVAPIPTLDVTAPQAVYVNSSFTVSAVASEKGSFAWLHESYTDEGQTESSFPLTYAETGNKIVSVAFKDVYGCETSATATVKVKAMPSISFEKAEYEVLEGKTIVVTPVFANMPETVGSWSFEGNTVLAEVTTGVSATYKGLSEGTGIVSCSVNYSDNETGYSDVLKASCKITVIPFTESLVCDVDEIEIYVGESAVINAVVHALGAETYSLVLSDSSKVEVTDRMLTALSAGELEVYAVCDGNSELRDTVKVTVKEFISAKELSLPKQVTIKEGSDTTLVASIIPSNATYTEVFFLEKEDEVVKVTADGKVVGKSAGTSVVTASTKEGLQAQTLVYVTSSEEEIVKIRLNEGSENVYLKVGESKTIACQVSPTTIKANDLVWASGNTEIAEVSPSGVLTAKKVGEMFLFISYKTVIDEKIKVFVTNSVAPTISYIPSVTMQQPGAAVTIDLANYVKDDATALENLQFSFAENENIATSISGTVVTLNLKNAEFIGKTSISVSAQDEEALVSSRDIEIDVVQKENEAPQILTETIYIPEGKYAQIVVADMAIDDYTPSDELTFEFEESDNLLARLVKNNTTLRVYAIEDEWSGDEILKVTFTDVDGLSTTKDIHVLAQEIENQAPVLLAIPTQHENDTVLFPTIDLSKYVTDDFTSSSEIQWTASTSENVSVVISGHYAEIADLNKYWRGAEVVTFTAMDQGGLTSSMDVTFYREVATSEVEKEFGWYGKPTVNIIASRYYGTPGDEFTLIGTFYGSDCSGKWEVEGLELEDPNALIQNLTFDTLGNYNVTFTVMYGEGDVTNVGEVLGVVGIAERNPGICIGDIQVLTATEGMDSYLWSTGETSQSIQVNPNVTTDYTLQMTKGLTTFNDEVNLRVSVPVQLIQDSVMCEGTTYELVAQGEYETYAWNTGAKTKSIEIPAAVADYKVTTTDDLGCESSAIFSVTKVNPLPTLNLGEDKTLCDKEKLTLDAGEGYVYDWNITKYDGSLVSSDNQSIVLDSSAYVTVQITDNNMCESFDTINVTFTYPYKEEIGVVTFSQSSKNIIIAWERTADVNTKNYQVERQLTNNEWETVGDPVMFGEFGIVVDEVANYEKKAYKYRLVTTDECGNQAVSGEYRSSFLQQTRTVDGKLALNWWTYQSPREGNVVASYLWRMPAEQPTSGDGEIEQNGFETVESFSATEDFVGFTDDENVFQKGDLVRVAFELDETVYENAIKDESGEVIEYQNKAESGPFSLAVSNIAEVESTSDVVDLFPADVAVYPTVVKNVIHVALASQAYNNYNVEVISADGQVVAHTQTGDVTKALVDIPAEGLTQGIYTVKISVGEMTKTIKVLK